MRRITFRAAEALIDKTRVIAQSHGRTLSAAFREWLENYVARTDSVDAYDALMHRLRHILTNRRFTRAEMNQR